MEPQLPNPNFAPGPSNKETGPSLAAPESYGSFPTTSPERSPDKEKSPERTELNKAPSQALPAVSTPVANPAVAGDDAVNTSATQGAPTVASDDDVIEKEWVTKAKRVIAETKGNPYLQEKEVSKLQADYLQKRYGKQVKVPEDV